MQSLYDSINIQPEISLLTNYLRTEKEVGLSMLRLDKIHPIVSGNKLFKLQYFLQEAKSSKHKTIITFGGAYSNHLAATAFACKEAGLKCIGFVRGENPVSLSSTLLFCRQNGMQLEFISRADYKNISDEFLIMLLHKYGDHTLIPEGGFSITGAHGAEDIMKLFDGENYSHICCPIGTATTFAGLIKGNKSNAQIIGFSALKNLGDIEFRLKKLNVDKSKSYKSISDYHFGGYAKKTTALIAFMNNFYRDYKIPLDFVYTAKMMFGVYNLLEESYFAPGSNILCIHTGGLQGNNSLPPGTLNF
ncbi:MAG: pyridoxal-phosphate dependent enzyme [Ginsengibacter sp.]